MNKYAELSPDELQKHLEGFLIDHWSVSSVAAFTSNEKAFERKYIFKDYDKEKSLASHIGDVYHHALMEFFRHYQGSKERLGYDSLLQIAHSKLDQIGADEWKPQKLLTIVEQQLEALQRVNFMIENFLAEFDSYENEIQEVLFVETSFKEFVTINDIDVPVPLKFRPDLVFITKCGELAVLDHKGKRSYTEEKDIIMKYSNQAIGYKLGIDVAIQRFEDIIRRYPLAAEGVKKFYFYENKYTANRGGDRQIKQIPMDLAQHGQLFEQILFEGLFRMMEAVQNPDYVYLMNPHDYFEPGDKVIEFWIKTHVEGLEGFPNLDPHQIKLLKQRRSSIRRSALTGVPKAIIKAFSNPKDFVSLNQEDMDNLTIPEKIEHRLRTFNYPVKVEHTVEGYSCDTYLLQVAAGLKTSQIYGYRMDIANVIGVRDIRIAPSLVEYNGRAYVAIEVNRTKTTSLGLDGGDIPSGNVFPLGKDNYGHVMSWSTDNPSTPHLMIAGASGSGKSVTIQTIIEVAKHKGIKVAILDPKFEFLDYKAKGYKVINELADIEAFMEEKVKEMDHIFRTRGAHGATSDKQLIIFDEAADCFARQSKERRVFVDRDGVIVEAPSKKIEDAVDRVEAEELRAQWGAYATAKKVVDPSFKTLEENTLILAQKARSAGIHLVLAAQRFSVKVLTGDAKANFSTRLCLTVASGVDSKVMLDQEGAEKLNGKGDALLTSPEHPEPVRLQCFSMQQ